jgi:hypothetical protein
VPTRIIEVVLAELTVGGLRRNAPDKQGLSTVSPNNGARPKRRTTWIYRE